MRMSKSIWIFVVLIIGVSMITACGFSPTPADYSNAQEIVDEFIEESKPTPEPTIAPTLEPLPREGLFFSDSFRDRILAINPSSQFDPADLTPLYAIYANNYPGDGIYAITYVMKPDLTLVEIGESIGNPLFGKPIDVMNYSDTLAEDPGSTGVINVNVNIYEGDEGYTVMLQYVMDGSLQLITDIFNQYMLIDNEMYAELVTNAQIYYQGFRYNPGTSISRVSTVWQMDPGLPAGFFERLQEKFNGEPEYTESEFVGHLATKMGFFTAVDDENPKAPVEIEVDDDSGMFKLAVGIMDF